MSTKITAIDGVMGAGKTTYMIAQMNKHLMQRYLYITPFLDEVGRIKDACSARNFKEPVEISGTKMEGLKALVKNGMNIVTTHTLFKNIDIELRDERIERNYTLVIDETFDSTDIQKVSPFAKSMVAESDCVSINEDTGLMSWVSPLPPSEKGEKTFYEIMQKCNRESLYWFDSDNKDGDGFIVWQFPPKAFQCFNQVFILTYQFEDSLMDYYMRVNHLEYSIDSRFAEQDKASRAKFKGLIEFIGDDIPWVKALGENNLSSSWFDRLSNADAKKMCSSIKTLCNKHKAHVADLMWTIFKGSALRFVNKNNALHKPYDEKATESEKTKCNFVPCSARATNRYGHRSFLIYLCNRFPHPSINQYFQKRDQALDRDKFALNEMLQWLFRSRIRNDEPIKLFLPSPRMRRLLEDWLDGKELEAHETTGLAA